MELGFSGMMLDTLDTPPFLEQQQPDRHRGMAAAAVELVRAMRIRYPNFPIIVNRAYAILPSLTDVISAVIAESLLTRPTDSAAEWLSPADVRVQLALLEPARAAGLPILSLDYWPLDDFDAIALIYGRERALGHHPYVSQPLLDVIVPEPRDRVRSSEMPR
jgi:polysaccharide biosynthesis protein PelA